MSMLLDVDLDMADLVHGISDLVRSLTVLMSQPSLLILRETQETVPVHLVVECIE
jgi:hypothetical protein